MRLSRPLALAILLLSPPRAADASEPANLKASPRARAVLDYLGGLPRSAEKRLISGQFTNDGPGASLAMCEQAFAKTGHWPGMIGLDYCGFGTGGLHTPTVNGLAIAYARQGGLVTLSVHLPNPANPNGGGLRDKGVDLATLLEPGHENHRRWLKELDIMAEGLAGLRDAGVVLWRPFHEMNGGWFWWGGKDLPPGLAAPGRVVR